MKMRSDATCVAEKTSMPRFISIKELPQTKARAIKIVQGRKREEILIKWRVNLASKIA